MAEQSRLRVIVAGGRDFIDRDYLYERLDHHFRKFSDNELEIVHGGAPDGADKFADDYAKECSLQYIVFEADWIRYGDSAGPRRNAEMAKYAHALIAFWDGKSRGTKSMINQAKKYSIPYTVYNYTNERQSYLKLLEDHGITEEEDEVMSGLMDDIYRP